MYKILVFAHVSKNMLPERFCANKKSFVKKNVEQSHNNNSKKIWKWNFTKIYNYKLYKFGVRIVVSFSYHIK